MLNYEEISAKTQAKASVIWLHGLGASGHDFMPIAEALQLPASLGLRFIFPHAPIQPVTLNMGIPMPAWYDIFGLHKTAKQDEAGVLRASKQVADLIEQEHQRGVPYNKIILAGFSQGGAVALCAGLHFPQRLAGILALSTYLPIAKVLLANVSQANRDVPIMMLHGTQDPTLSYEIGQISHQYLINHGYQVDWREYPMAHEVCASEVNDIAVWFEQRLSC